MHRQNTATRGKKGNTKSSQAKALAMQTEDAPETYAREDQDYNEHWLTSTLGEKERSRVRRQMKARMELERRMEEKRLNKLVDDWCFDDNF